MSQSKFFLRRTAGRTPPPLGTWPVVASISSLILFAVFFFFFFFLREQSASRCYCLPLCWSWKTSSAVGRTHSLTRWPLLFLVFFFFFSFSIDLNFFFLLRVRAHRFNALMQLARAPKIEYSYAINLHSRMHFFFFSFLPPPCVRGRI